MPCLVSPDVLACSSDLVRSSLLLCTEAAGLAEDSRVVRATAIAARRARGTAWIGGGAPDINDLSEARTCVRLRLAQGLLRRDAGTAHVVMSGTGRPCHACDRAVERGQSGTLVSFRDGGLLRFHAMCFWAWQIERHVVASPPQPV